MGPEDRDYFVKRALQERHAATQASCPEARGRHEEMASLYRMRIMYIDRGLFGSTDEPALVMEKTEDAARDPQPPALVRQIIPAG